MCSSLHNAKMRANYPHKPTRPCFVAQTRRPSRASRWPQFAPAASRVRRGGQRAAVRSAGERAARLSVALGEWRVDGGACQQDCHCEAAAKGRRPLPRPSGFVRREPRFLLGRTSIFVACSFERRRSPPPLPRPSRFNCREIHEQQSRICHRLTTRTSRRGPALWHGYADRHERHAGRSSLPPRLALVAAAGAPL